MFGSDLFNSINTLKTRAPKSNQYAHSVSLRNVLIGLVYTLLLVTNIFASGSSNRTHARGILESYQKKEVTAATEQLWRVAETNGSIPTISSSSSKLALVIGNASYRHAGTLKNPINDASDIAKTLENIGFQVILGLDLDKGQMNQKIQEFARTLSGTEVGLFFYAGHGLQVDGKNYLVPIDAKLDDASGIDFELVQADLVQRSMERATQTNIIFLDACRNNPLARNLAKAMGTRSVAIGRGLAATEGGAGTLISFSTQPGNVALDGASRNSPFAEALTRRIEAPGESLSDVLIKVRRDVIAATNKQQVPWEHSALTNRLVFVAANADTKPAQQHTETSDAPDITNKEQQGQAKETVAELSTNSRQTKVAECAALAPGNSQDVKESFRGEVEGKLSGIVSKLTGGMASLKGEYDKVIKDTLKEYPESHRLYVWQRLIYLACVNKESGLNINDLAEAYLVGPSLFGSGGKVKVSDLQVQLVGFDRTASIKAYGHYAISGPLREVRFPDLVFMLTNVSDHEITVGMEECTLVDFKFPEPIKVTIDTFSFGRPAVDKTISAITGTTGMSAVGPWRVRISAGQKKYVSFGISRVDPPSFEARQNGKSFCSFSVGDGTISNAKDVEIVSPRKYLAQ